MPSRRGRKVRPNADVPDRKRKPRDNDIPMRRVKNMMAGFEQKERVYNTVVPMAAELPPYMGEYTDELGQALGDMVIEGTTLDDFKIMPNVPPYAHLLRWIRDKEHPFHTIFYEAKRAQVALYEERIIKAATQSEDTVVVTNRQVVDALGTVHNLVDKRHVDNVQRSELKVKAMQWSLGWMDPNRHGRNADPNGGKPNDQLSSLFAALMSGPAKEKEDA